MYIALIKTKNTEVSNKETSFENAWTSLNELVKNWDNVLEAVVLEEPDQPYDEFDFSACKVVASLKVVK